LRAAFICIIATVIVLPIVWPAEPARAQTETETCLDCHDDSDLVADDGRNMGVLADLFRASIHGDQDCIDCHSTPGDYEDVPHFDRYVAVNCGKCHEDAISSFAEGFHGRARQRGNVRAPGCADCHGVAGNAHAIHGLDARTAEDACRRCHTRETVSYDAGVHAEAATEGKSSPGCVSCHVTHGLGLPPSAGAVNAMCEVCHRGAMADVKRGGHMQLGEDLTDVVNCASCHDAHGTHKPHLSKRVAEACKSCHDEQMREFEDSVHEDLFDAHVMNCLSCHSTHKDEEEVTEFDGGCGACHHEVEEEYRGSVHRLGRLRGDEGAATCADCHEGHHVLAAADSTSPISHFRIPYMCGECHGADAVVTSDYVRLPISLPNYLESVHGIGWRKGEHTAVCTDCHGTHNLRTAQDPSSMINRFHLAETCAACHGLEARRYQNSVHGKALAMGIQDSPACTTCHEEHLIRQHDDPRARVSAEHRARQLCGDCHTDPALVARYGIAGGVVESFLDSYHGWAIDRGSQLVANCTDCHNTHEIRSRLDPESSIHLANVTETCGRCHEGSNPTFAQSYTHEGALKARGYHGWARLIYLCVIAIVLGGMALHNLVVVRYELARHIRKRRRVPYVIRWQRPERIQHLFLLLSFFGLAITGFALRYPEAWWVKLAGLGGHEAFRANLHRILALVMTVVFLSHAVFAVVTRRGRWALNAVSPRMSDFAQALQNMAFHFGLRKERPAFGMFDYTQKAEYWAVVWGTLVMALTGFVLWFPTLATDQLPAWVVRVAEVIHYYEAVLAVAAIIIWHIFYVIFMPNEYPMSTVWLNGRVPAEEWKEMHRGEYLEIGEREIVGARDDARDDTVEEPPDGATPG
jgi:formate dehydrogenase gamma subunit